MLNNANTLTLLCAICTQMRNQQKNSFRVHKILENVIDNINACEQCRETTIHHCTTRSNQKVAQFITCELIHALNCCQTVQMLTVIVKITAHWQSEAHNL